MQSVFNRARSQQNKAYESWKESGPGAYQHFQRDDWYWKSDPSYKNHKTNYRSTIKDTGNYAMSHHYSVLGLDRYILYHPGLKNIIYFSSSQIVGKVAGLIFSLSIVIIIFS